MNHCVVSIEYRPNTQSGYASSNNEYVSVKLIRVEIN